MPIERVSLTLRRQIRLRAQGLCEYCRCPAFVTNAAFHCEHILPRESGGKTTLANLAWACPWCNSHKYTKTEALDPQTGKVVPLFHPRRQRWPQHFTWSEDFLRIVGRTTIGRATIEALHLNRPELLNLRRLLCATGEYPPEASEL